MPTHAASDQPEMAFNSYCSCTGAHYPLAGCISLLKNVNGTFRKKQLCITSQSSSCKFTPRSRVPFFCSKSKLRAQGMCCSSSMKPRIPVGPKPGEVQQHRIEPIGSILTTELLPGACPAADQVLSHQKGDVRNVPRAQFWNREAWSPWKSCCLKEN